MQDNKVVVISGTMGSGKNAVLQGVLDKCSNCVRLVTATTRTMRPGEEHGKDYYFMSEEDFMNAKEQGLIPEHRFVETGAHYGIYTPVLEERLAERKIVLAQLDIVGARYLKKQYGALTIFIKPQSFEELEERVRSRAPMSDEEWAARKLIAEREISEFMPWYDYIVENPNGKLHEAVDAVLALMRQKGYNV